MKKLLIIPALAIFASCGGPSVCDCVNMDRDKADDKMKTKCEEMEKEWKDKYEKASDDEKKKLEEEVKACKKD